MAGYEFGHHGHRNTGSFTISDKFRLSNSLPSMHGGKKKKVSHQFLLPDLSGEHPLRFITDAGNTESRKSWVTYFAAELKLYFCF